MSRAPRHGLTKERRERAIRAYRETGLYARAAEAAGVDDSSMRAWRRKHPDFEAELDEAGRAYDEDVGVLARSVLRQRLEEMRDRVRPSTQAIVQKTGQVVELLQPHHYDVATLRTALMKHDPDWVRPKLTKEEEQTVRTFINEVIAARETK